MPTLQDLLTARTHDAAPALVETIDRGRIRCHACGHQCPIPDGAMGVCKVRFNEGGRLRVPWGYVAGVQCDPVEKKPFFHALPGSTALSFGMLGCDFHCGYCQNWLTSQALRDPEAAVAPEPLSAAELVRIAQERGYAEADPSLDVGGQDAAAKLAILIQLAFGTSGWRRPWETWILTRSNSAASPLEMSRSNSS